MISLRTFVTNTAPVAREHWVIFTLAAFASTVIVRFDGFEHVPLIARSYRGLEVDKLLLVLLVFAAAFCWVGLGRSRRLHREVERRIGAERDALSLALRDPLTGLLNRRALDGCLSAPLDAGTRRAVLIVDIDRFKEINDWRGHEAGDAVLVEIARRLRVIAEGEGATLVRMGGDEFLLAFDVAAGSTRPDQVAQAIVEIARGPIAYHDDFLHVAASVGVATAGERAEERQALLRRADEAMYQAKRAGRAALHQVQSSADHPTLTGFADLAVDDHEPTASPLAQRRFLERAMIRTGLADDRPIFIAAVAVDRFAGIRSVIGPERAALLLRGLSDRAVDLGDGTCVARLTHDTLGVGFRAADVVHAGALLDRLRDRFQEEISLGGNILDLTVTIGFAGPDDAQSIRRLTEQAQTALDRAHSAKERLVQFIPADPSRIDPLSLMRDLRAGLAAGDLWLCYQPKMLARTGQIDSMEALLRWRHPELGMIPPDQFIGVAEQTGYIRDVTRWVLRQALNDQRVLAAAGHSMRVYINISARLLSENSFVQEAIAVIGNRAGEFGFEITETAVLEDPTTAIGNLQAIRDAGIHIAIDDYGAGMSSLSYLKQLPAHELKIDRMFVSELTNNHRDPLLVRSTIDLAHGLGMRVTAEGVDTPSAMALLKVMGCDLLQGFLIAKPMPIARTIAFLDEAAKKTHSPEPDIASFLSGEEYWTAALSLTGPEAPQTAAA